MLGQSLFSFLGFFFFFFFFFFIFLNFYYVLFVVLVGDFFFFFFWGGGGGGGSVLVAFFLYISKQLFQVALRFIELLIFILDSYLNAQDASQTDKKKTLTRLEISSQISTRL